MFGHPIAHIMAVNRWRKIAPEWTAPKQPWMATELINNGAFDTIQEVVLRTEGSYENIIGIRNKENKLIKL